MRPIDADALKALIDEGWNDGPFKTAFFEEIESAPTIEPPMTSGYVATSTDEPPVVYTEQKRGKWIKVRDSNSVLCSACFDDFDYIDGLCYLCHGQELPNYCPNCGAKMERSEDD